jgi:hypothetical protein
VRISGQDGVTAVGSEDLRTGWAERAVGSGRCSTEGRIIVYFYFCHPVLLDVE